MEEPRFYQSSDYAGIDFKGGSFYYGYEYAICEECGKKNNGEYCDDHEEADRDWCFVATINEEETVIPFSELGHKYMFDVVECLGSGIAIFMGSMTLTKRD